MWKPRSRPPERDRARRGPSPAERLARSERAESIERGEAVLVGSLAGVVEWADDAWTRLTGFPLDETVEKPITHFLDRAGLERELVEFVAHHFLEGRACTVALPFDTFDGRHIDVELEVERWRDPDSDATHFIAVARDVTDALPASDDSQTTVPTRDVVGNPVSRLHDPEERVALGRLVEEALDRARPGLEDARALDVHFDCDGNSRVAPTSRLRRVLDALLEAAQSSVAQGGAFISVVAGDLEPRRSHHSLVHAIPNRAVASRGESSCYVEVHDTGPHLDLASDPLSTHPEESRLAAYTRARRIAAEAGATLHLDSTPGCGTQALLVLDPAGD